MARITIHDIKEKSPEVGEWLFENYPGMHLDIPKKTSSFNFKTSDERDDYIFNLCYESGKSYEDIASMMDMSKETVRKIVSNRIIKGKK